MAETIPSIVAHLRAGVYTCAAGGTVLIYDILLTSKDEVRLIWGSSFSLVKCLYLVNRYLPVPCLILGMHHLANLRGPLSTTFCRLVTLSQTAGQAVSLVAATWLLVIRVLALYPQQKVLAFALYFVFITTHVVTIVLSAIIIHELWGGLAYIEFMGICAANPSHLLGIAYFMPVICEVVLVALQLFHAYRHTRRLLINTHLPITPLLRTLYADGFAYFVVVVTLRLWSGFIFTMADFSYWYLSTYFEFALISISISRLVLHLRRAAEIHRQSDMNTGSSFPLSQLTQSADLNENANDNDNVNPYRNSNFYNKQNRNSHLPLNRNYHHHHHRRKPRQSHTLSSFHGTTGNYTNSSDVPQVHFSRLGHVESIASTGASASGVDSNRGLLGIQDAGGRYGDGGYDHESRGYGVCYDEFDGDGGRREGDDHSYVELFSTSPGSRTERRESTPSSPCVGDVQGGRYGYGEDVQLKGTVDARDSAHERE